MLRYMRVQIPTHDSSTEWPLPADLCGWDGSAGKLDFRCAITYVMLMHVRSRMLLKLAWKAAAGGTCVWYQASHASPIAITAQNGLRLLRIMML